MDKEALIESLKILKEQAREYGDTTFILDINIDCFKYVINSAIKALEQKPEQIKDDMLHDIYMEGVNMSGEYHGCWVRFKNIENIVESYFNRED